MVSLENMRYRYPGVHVHDGIVMSRTFPGEKIDAAKDYVFTENHILVDTYPKSGTTWMQEIVWLLTNECNFEKANTILLDDRWVFLEHALQGPGQSRGSKATDAEHKHQVTFVKSHLQQRQLDAAVSKGRPRVIVVLRNPKDVLASQYNFYKMNKGLGCFGGTWDEFFEMFKNKELQFGYWLDHVTGWWSQRKLLNHIFVMYEAMKRKPRETLEKVAQFLDIGVSDEMLDGIIAYTDFDNMRKNPMANKSNCKTFDENISKFMRKGVIGDWRNYFSAEQSNFVDGVCEELCQQGLSFEYD